MKLSLYHDEVDAYQSAYNFLTANGANDAEYVADQTADDMIAESLEYDWEPALMESHVEFIIMCAEIGVLDKADIITPGTYYSEDL